MSFSKREQASGLIGILVLALVGSVVVRSFGAGGLEEYFNPNKRVENKIVAALEGQPGGKVMLERLETDFPLQYEDFLETMTDQAIADQSPDRIVEAGNAWLSRFLGNHTNDFKYAPIESLDNVLSLELAALSQLEAQEPLLCDNYVRGWALPENLPDELFVSISAVRTSQFEAIKAGREDQQLRFDITPRDIEALRQTLRDNATSDGQLAYVMDGEEAGVEKAGQKCDAIEALLSGISEQPEGRRALLVGTLLMGS